MQSVVVGFVDTPEGHAAIDKALEEAALRAMRVLVVHSMKGGTRERPEDHIASARALEALNEKLDQSGVPYESHDYVRGNTPAEDLMEAVGQHDGALIVIGIRERSATGKLMLGSNALDILHDATVPVLCVKASQA